MHLGGVIQDLVSAHAEEADEHELDNGPHAGGGRADAGTDEAGFGDGRIADAVGPELAYQPLGQLEHATPGVFLARPAGTPGDVLTHDEDGRVALELLTERLVDCLNVGDGPNGLLRLHHLSPPRKLGEAEPSLQEPSGIS